MYAILTPILDCILCGQMAVRGVISIFNFFNCIPRQTMASKLRQMSKKRKFVADGVFYAELNELLIQELGEDGYAGVDLRVTPVKTEIVIRATRTQNVLGEKGQRIRELTSIVQKRYVLREF